MTNTAPITEGDTVVGTYMGVPFEGTVDSTRGHTINWNLRLTFVTLTAPIDVHGSARESLCLTTAYDGSSYVDSRGYDSETSVRVVVTSSAA